MSMDLRNGVCDEFLRCQPASVKQRSYCTRAPDELSAIIFIVEGHLKLLIILLFNTVYEILIHYSLTWLKMSMN